MLFVKYGILPTNIGADEYIVKCPCCETDSWADVIVISNYYHFSYYVPIFPVAKEANVYCKKCELKRYGMAFDSKLIGNYSEVKQHYRHPWFTYIGISIAALAVIAIVIAVSF